MSRKIKRARETIRNAFDANAGFKYAYVANISCVIHDNFENDKKEIAKALLQDMPYMTWEKSNEVAEKIINLIFYS